MRIRVSGPHLGPVHATSWSPGDSNSGCGCLAALLVTFALIGLAVEYWYIAAAAAGVIAVAGLAVWLAGRRDEARAAARMAAEREPPESPAAHGDRR